MFYEQFQSLCRQKGVSESEVAKALGFSTATPWKWSLGTIPRNNTLKKLAAYFDVSPEYFFGNGNDKGNQITDSHASGNIGTVTMTKNGPAPSQQGTGASSLEMEFWNVFNNSLDFQGKAAVMLKATEERKRMEQENGN